MKTVSARNQRRGAEMLRSRQGSGYKSLFAVLRGAWSFMTVIALKVSRSEDSDGLVPGDARKQYDTLGRPHAS